LIRRARPDEVETIRSIERRAAAKFRGSTYAFVVDSEPDDANEVAAAIDAGLAFVAVDAADQPVGFLTAMTIAEGLYLKEIDVDPAAQGAGIGRALIAALVVEAGRRASRAIWLRTFLDVPWNAPWYARQGFARVADGLPDSIAAALLDHECEAGFDPATRCTMMKRLD
jgi:GNAT superfamily N-acetyltransferase